MQARTRGPLPLPTGSDWGRLTTNSGSWPLSRNSTEPGANSQVFLGCSDEDVLQGEAYSRLRGANSRSACAFASFLLPPPRRPIAGESLDVLGQFHFAIMALYWRLVEATMAQPVMPRPESASQAVLRRFRRS